MSGPTDPLTSRALVHRALVDRMLFGAVVVTSLVVLFAPTAGGLPLFPYADKMVHLVLFAALAWSGRKAGLPVLPLAAGLMAYAVLSEVIQATVLPERGGEWTDVAADLIGITAGMLAGSRREHSSGPAPHRQGQS